MSNTHLARLLLMSELRRKPKHNKRIKTAAAEGQCIIEGCTSEMKCRGLCVSHANEFFGQKRTLTKKQWLAFERDNITEGLVLPPHEQRQLTKKSVFVSEAS